MAIARSSINRGAPACSAPGTTASVYSDGLGDLQLAGASAISPSNRRRDSMLWSLVRTAADQRFRMARQQIREHAQRPRGIGDLHHHPIEVAIEG